MLAIRLVKTAMVASTALFALLVAYNNLADYNSNYEFVRHTLSMDTTFPDNALKGRAITSPALWALAYWSIILAEAATGLVLAFGAFRLMLALRAPAAVFCRQAVCRDRRRSGLSGVVHGFHGRGRRMVPDVAVQDVERPAGGVSLLYDAACCWHI